MQLLKMDVCQDILDVLFLSIVADVQKDSECFMIPVFCKEEEDEVHNKNCFLWQLMVSS